MDSEDEALLAELAKARGEIERLTRELEESMTPLVRETDASLDALQAHAAEAAAQLQALEERVARELEEAGKILEG